MVTFVGLVLIILIIFLAKLLLTIIQNPIIFIDLEFIAISILITPQIPQNGLIGLILKIHLIPQIPLIPLISEICQICQIALISYTIHIFQTAFISHPIFISTTIIFGRRILVISWAQVNRGFGSCAAGISVQITVHFYQFFKFIINIGLLGLLIFFF